MNVLNLLSVFIMYRGQISILKINEAYRTFQEVYFLPVSLTRTLMRFRTLPYVLNAPPKSSSSCYQRYKYSKYLTVQNYEIYAFLRIVQHVSDYANS
jgi:hypothetical protein